MTYEFSEAALEYAETYYDFQDVGTDEDFQDFIAEALTKPNDAGFWDEDLYETHTLAFHTPDWDLTDEYIYGQANYRAALAILESLGAEAATVGHWTYSRYQCIKVPILDSDGKVTAAAVELYEMMRYIQDHYPVLDEAIYNELEFEVREAAYEQALRYVCTHVNGDTVINLTPEEESLVEDLYWDWEQAYWNESSYIDEDKLGEIILSVLSGEYQQHQATSLF